MATRPDHRPSDNPDASSDDRARRRGRYQAVLRVVQHQTDNPASPSPITRAGIKPNRVVLYLVGHGRYTDPEKIRRSIRAAREQGDLFQWRDEDGDRRLSRTTREGVEAVVADVNRWESPDRELIELCSGLLPEENQDGE